MYELLGLLVIAAGFALRLNALAVVIAAAFVSGMIAGFSVRELAMKFGTYFIDNRYMMLPLVLMLPVVGVLERHGLHEQVATLMRRAARASAGGVLWMYQVVRAGASVIGLSIGNHASMVRPLVAPMAEAAAAKERALDESERATIRAHAAASENVGNFFADDIVVAVGALLLIHGVFQSAALPVELSDLQKWSIPTAIWAAAVGWWRCRRLDSRLRAGAKEPPP